MILMLFLAILLGVCALVAEFLRIGTPKVRSGLKNDSRD